MPTENLQIRFALALETRRGLVQPEPRTACRLFAGFYEGWPKLAVDLYGHTLVLNDYARGESGTEHIQAAQDFYLDSLPWIQCVIQKQRHAKGLSARRGRITYGGQPDTKIQEHGIQYAVDLLMNQDASFYLDTRGLRKWIMASAAGWQVLNTFAYTGSIGIAALAGGAAHVLQTDRSKKFMALARGSAMHSRLDLGKMKLRRANFFNEIARLKRERTLFDCVILDPPFFSSTPEGTVDQARESTRLINKVRPLVKDRGKLVLINNALYLSGAAYIQSLEALSQDGYLTIEEIIPIPDDITGYPGTILGKPPVDPAPFNHPTKIVITGVRRK